MLWLFIENLWGTLLELSPWLLIGAVAGGLLHGLVPPEFVQRQLTGGLGVVKAVFLGVPLPLCSCGVIPAGLSLRRAGASTGASLGFLIATPQTGLDSVLVSASFLGWPFALYKVGASFLTGIIGGAIADRVDAAGPQASGCDEAAVDEGQEDRSPLGMVLHGVDLIRVIWRWLVFGIILSAVLGTVLPADAFAGMSAYGGALAFGLVLAISVPLYICATASVPIAAALVAGGLPTGAALVFLMAGPATNVATIGAVRKAFGGRTLAVYLVTIIVGSMGLGLLYEALLGQLTVIAPAEHVHEGSWWAIAATGALLLLFAWFAIEDLLQLVAKVRVSTSRAQRVEIPVTGMTCGGCAARLQRVLAKQEGVDAATVSFDDGCAVVLGSAALDVLHHAIRDAGFETA